MLCGCDTQAHLAILDTEESLMESYRHELKVREIPHSTFLTHVPYEKESHCLSHCCMRMQMFVFFPEDLKVGVKTIKTYAERMRSEGVGRAMMVTVANITPFARQCLTEMHHKYYIETVRLSCYLSSARLVS